MTSGSSPKVSHMRPLNGVRFRSSDGAVMPVWPVSHASAPVALPQSNPRPSSNVDANESPTGSAVVGVTVVLTPQQPSLSRRGGMPSSGIGAPGSGVKSVTF
jgi:hypothetical protein